MLKRIKKKKKSNKNTCSAKIRDGQGVVGCGNAVSKANSCGGIGQGKRTSNRAGIGVGKVARVQVHQPDSRLVDTEHEKGGRHCQGRQGRTFKQFISRTKKWIDLLVYGEVYVARLETVTVELAYVLLIGYSLAFVEPLFADADIE